MSDEARPSITADELRWAIRSLGDHTPPSLVSTFFRAADELDALRADLAAAKAEVEDWKGLTRQLQDEDLPAVRKELEEALAWEDVHDEWSDAIDAAHPLRSESHDTYGVAMQMVGHRHSKGSLVELVNWLLVQRDERQGMVEHWVRQFKQTLDERDALTLKLAEREAELAEAKATWEQTYLSMMASDENLRAAINAAEADRVAGIRVALNEVEKPTSIACGAPGSEMRRAWDLGKRLARAEVWSSELTSMTERYEVNTALMHARTKAMNEAHAKLAEREAELARLDGEFKAANDYAFKLAALRVKEHNDLAADEAGKKGKT